MVRHGACPYRILTPWGRMSPSLSAFDTVHSSSLEETGCQPTLATNAFPSLGLALLRIGARRLAEEAGRQTLAKLWGLMPPAIAPVTNQSAVRLAPS